MSFKNINFRGRTIVLLLFLTGLLYLNINNPSLTNVQAASGSFTEDFTTTTYMDSSSTNVSGWGKGSIENSKKEPTIIGNISSSLIGDTLDVFVDGDYAYVTNENEGLKIVNISNPSNPNIVGSYSTPDIAQSVFIDGDYAFLADFHGDTYWVNFQVLDVSDPTNPLSLGNCSTFYYARAVVVEGNYAYVANSEYGLSIVDISDPSNPSQTRVINTNGKSYDLAIAGNYIFLADGTNGLVVMNITNPLTPSIVATYKTSISCVTNVVLEGNYAFIIDLDVGVIVLDVKDPTTPMFVELWSKSGVSDAYVYGDFLYVTDISGGLSALNITNPTTPQFIQTISLPGTAQTIVIDGIYAYLACQTGGFQVVKIADPSFPPTLVGSYNTPGGSLGVYVSGDYAYVADNDFFVTLDISDPLTPSLVNSYSISGLTWNVFISGDLAYLASGSAGLQILNISNPSSPTNVGSYVTPDSAHDIFVSGNYAFIADEYGGLQILDITDPTSPTFTSNYATTHRAWSIFVSGNYAYLTDYDNYELVILNITNPSSPTFVGSYITPWYTSDVYVSGNYAYLTHTNGFLVLNVSVPSIPTLAGSYANDYPTSVFISGDYAYVANGYGLIVLDIENPSSPTFFGSCNTPGDTWGIFISGDYAYIADDAYGIQVVEVRKNRARQFTSLCVAQSNTAFSASSSNIISAKLVASENITSSTSITYSLSVDGGNIWETITPGIEHDFSNIGNQLKWKTILTTSDVSVSPLIHNLSIYYNTNLIAPSLDLPLDSYIADDYTPTFTWFGVDGETNYLFQLSTSTSFTSPLLNLTLPSLSTSYTPITNLDPNTYYWRVAGVDSEGDIGLFSAYRTIYVIEDTDVPFIDDIVDFSYPYNQTGNSLTWHPTDSNPAWYNITIDGILEDEGPWGGESITINVDDLDVGVHTVICYVYDVEGLSNADIVSITVNIIIPEFGRLYYSILVTVPVIIVIFYKKQKQLF